MAKLLIAVKSEIMGAVLAEVLTHHGVHICHNGRDALALLESLRPDIFIVELSLPVITGLAVLQRTCFLPPVILALTNLITESVLQTAADAGVHDMILMPCTVRHIVSRLDMLIQNAPAPEV